MAKASLKMLTKQTIFDLNTKTVSLQAQVISFEKKVN